MGEKGEFEELEGQTAGSEGEHALGVTVLRLLSHVATVMAASLDMAADGGASAAEWEGADWGREGGGGETETRRAADEPRPDRKREATTLPVADDDGKDEDDWKRLGWGARGDWERRWARGGG